MRLPDLFRDCVCFLYREVEGEAGAKRSYGGTGFFVALEQDGGKHLYLITAKHCVQRADMRGGLWARYTDNFGETQTRRLPPLDKWETPNDSSVDVAVVSFGIGSRHIRAAIVGKRVLANEEMLQELNVGPGDDVAIVGLFTEHTGKAKNQPIVRSGIIAAMPEEKIFDSKTGQSFQAYLVEARSIGALSGSPVFVNIGYSRGPDGKINSAGRNFVIGVIRGHWDYPESAQESEEELRAVNMGMSTVTPIGEVIALLYGENLTNQRQQAYEDSLLNASLPDEEE